MPTYIHTQNQETDMRQTKFCQTGTTQSRFWPDWDRGKRHYVGLHRKRGFILGLKKIK